MFLLHERTRKSLCRLGFVALCVVPTCAVALWAASRNGEPHRARCEAELSFASRLHVTLGRVEHPEPGVVRYRDVVFGDPETHRQIAQASALEARSSEASLALAASELRLETESLGAIWGLLNDRLRQRGPGNDTAFRFAAEHVTLALPTGDLALHDVRARIEPTSDGRGVRLTFRTADMDAHAQPIALTIVRSREAAAGFELQTHGASLPLSLVAAAVRSERRTPISDRTATEAKRRQSISGEFAGVVQARQTAGGWEVAVQGSFVKLDLEELLGSWIRHRLTGTAQLELKSAFFRHGRLEEAQGRLVVLDGAIAHSLTAAAVESLNLRAAASPDFRDGAMSRYDWLAFDFAIDADGLWLKGCNPKQPAVVLAAQARPILLEPLGTCGPAVQLLRALLSDDEPLVPATREAEELMRWLPLAPAIRSAN